MTDNWGRDNPKVQAARDGWEIETAEKLAEAGEITINGNRYDVEGVDPEIGFIEFHVVDGEDRFWCEMTAWGDRYENHSVSMHTDSVEVPERDR